MNDLVVNLIPRKFFSEDNEDKYIYSEGMQVQEMYFVQEGLVTIGYTMLGQSIHKSQVVIAKRQKGIQLICDYYVLHQKKSNFVYTAKWDTQCFSLNKSVFHDNVFVKYADYAQEILDDSKLHYEFHTYHFVTKHKQKSFRKLTQKTDYNI